MLALEGGYDVAVPIREVPGLDAAVGVLTPQRTRPWCSSDRHCGRRPELSRINCGRERR